MYFAISWSVSCSFCSWLMLRILASNLSLPLHFPGELLTLYRSSPVFSILIDVVHSTFEAAQLKILYRIDIYWEISSVKYSIFYYYTFMRKLCVAITLTFVSLANKLRIEK